MTYEELAGRAEVLMWIALVFCAVEIVRGMTRWHSGGQRDVSAGIAAALAPLVFLLRNIGPTGLWLALLLLGYGIVTIWRVRLSRRDRAEERRERSRADGQSESSNRGLGRSAGRPLQRLPFVLVALDIAVVVLVVMYLANPFAAAGAIVAVVVINVLSWVRLRGVSPLQHRQ